MLFNLLDSFSDKCWKSVTSEAMKYNLVFIQSVYSVKLMYTTNDNIPSCYDDTKSKYIFSARFLVIELSSTTHMKQISTLTGNKKPHSYSEVTGM